MNFKNKTVLVTGANRGIGKEIVNALLKKGVKKIYAASRNTKNLPDFSDDRIVGLALDITQKNQIEMAAKTANDVEILINNAGIANFGSLLDAPLADIERDMNTNYYGTLNMIRAFVPTLETKKDTSIVNVVTIGAFASFPQIGGYCASKSALFSLSQNFRSILAPKGITVHTVNPGPVDTDMAKSLDIEKTSASVTAKNIISGLENNEADIFPDPQSKGMFDVWKNNYRDLESAMAQS